MPALTVDGTVNLRDTGGTPLTGGGTSAAGVLYRSEGLGSLTEAGLVTLGELGVRTVIDLRSDEERASAPDRLPEGATAVELPLLEAMMSGGGRDLNAVAAAAKEMLGDPASMGRLYIDMLRNSPATFAEVARLVASAAPGRAALVHCTAGKDRTGVSVALLLTAVGADRAAVVADYAASQSNLQGAWVEALLAPLAAHGFPVTDEFRALATATPPEAMVAALDWLDTAHGGSANYLREAGLSEPDVQRLRAALVG